jgi:hypothetical protein
MPHYTASGPIYADEFYWAERHSAPIAHTKADALQWLRDNPSYTGEIMRDYGQGDRSVDVGRDLREELEETT